MSENKVMLAQASANYETLKARLAELNAEVEAARLIVDGLLRLEDEERSAKLRAAGTCQIVQYAAAQAVGEALRQGIRSPASMQRGVRLI